MDNAAGPSGIFGILVGMSPKCTHEWLILFSMCLVVCQLIHWMYRFARWARK